MKAQQMKQHHLLPILLLVGGSLGASYYFIEFLANFFTAAPSVEHVLHFAVASILAVIGWKEIRATDDFENS